MVDLDLNDLESTRNAGTLGDWCTDYCQAEFGPLLGFLAYTMDNVLVVLDLTGKPHKLRREDADLIVTAVNNLQPLIDRVRELEKGLRLIAARGYQSEVTPTAQFSDKLTDTAKATLAGKKGPEW